MRDETSDSDRAPALSPKKDGFPKAVLSVTGHDIVNYFNQLDGDVSCPVCNADMNVMAAIEVNAEGHPTGRSEGRPAIVGMPVHEVPELGAEIKTPAFPLRCVGCGLISYFMFGPILEWMRNNDGQE